MPKLRMAHNDQRWIQCTSRKVFAASLFLNVILIAWILHASLLSSLGHGPGIGDLQSESLVWNGGHPSARQTGSCYCSGLDNYCMCTPSLAIDLVIASGKDHVWLVRRKDTGQMATMGGFVMIGETVDQAVKRELKEETGIVFEGDPTLLGVYSDPRRDNRRHTVSAVYAVHLDGTERPNAADDIKDVQRILLNDIESFEYFADHKTILLDYRASVRNGPPRRPSAGDFASDIVRSICSTGTTSD